ncbi:MAG: hypothetical protein AAGI23_01610 [Bacteroidota bacterium]
MDIEMVKTETNKEKSIQDFDKIIKLTETINDRVYLLEQRKMKQLVIAIASIALSIVCIFFVIDFTKAYGDVYVALVTYLGLFTLITGIVAVCCAILFLVLHSKTAKEIKKEALVLDELHGVVDGAFKFNLTEMDSLESTYYRLRMNRLKYY